jgi:hypothetical protein
MTKISAKDFVLLGMNKNVNHTLCTGNKLKTFLRNKERRCKFEDRSDLFRDNNGVKYIQRILWN